MHTAGTHTHTEYNDCLTESKGIVVHDNVNQVDTQEGQLCKGHCTVEGISWWSVGWHWLPNDEAAGVCVFGCVLCMGQGSVRNGVPLLAAAVTSPVDEHDEQQWVAIEPAALENAWHQVLVSPSDLDGSSVNSICLVAGAVSCHAGLIPSVAVGKQQHIAPRANLAANRKRRSLEPLEPLACGGRLPPCAPPELAPRVPDAADDDGAASSSSSSTRRANREPCLEMGIAEHSNTVSGK